MIGLDSAYVQESANQYIHVLEAYILAKNGCGRWSDFLGHFATFVSIHRSAYFNTVQQLTYVFKRVFREKPQES
jgi:hypothetical protein